MPSLSLFCLENYGVLCVLAKEFFLLHLFGVSHGDMNSLNAEQVFYFHYEKYLRLLLTCRSFLKHMTLAYVYLSTIQPPCLPRTFPPMRQSTTASKVDLHTYAKHYSVEKQLQRHHQLL